MKQFWQKNKLLIALFVFGIALCAYLSTHQSAGTSPPPQIHDSEQLISAPEENSNTATDTTTLTEPRELALNKGTVDTPELVTVDISPTSSTTAPESKNENTTDAPAESGMSITLSVPHIQFSESISMPAGSSAYDLMNTLRKKGILIFEDSDYGNLGRFIESIGGIKNDYKEKLFWIYSINGKKATIGISQYILHSQDIITWQYEKEDI